jgi:hypothetical protein
MTDTAGLEDRVESLESGQSKILSKLDELLGSGTRREPGAEDETSGRPASVEEQVRMELERKEREAADKAAKDAEGEERKTLREQLAEVRAKMAERPPQQPQPRRERVMWGKR